MVLKAATPKEPVSLEVVAVSPPESAEFVPHAKPRTVAFAPPVAVILPLRTAVVAVTDVADEVVTVGAFGANLNAKSTTSVVAEPRAASNAPPLVRSVQAVPVTATPSHVSAHRSLLASAVISNVLSAFG